MILPLPKYPPSEQRLIKSIYGRKFSASVLQNKDIKVGYKTLTAVGSIEQKCDGIKEYNFDGNTEGFPVVTSHYELIGSLDSTIIGVTDYSKFGL